jgi:hypothetical protein
VTGHEFEHWIHSLMKVKKDGGTLTLSHVGSSALIRFTRAAGHDAKCDLLIDVPRASWSEDRVAALRQLFERRGMEFFEPTENKGVLLRVRLGVTDIWDAASGAAGARIAQEVFSVMGAERHAEFRIAMKGENSARVWGPAAERLREGGNPVLRDIGRRIVDQIDAERRDSREGDR